MDPITDNSQYSVQLSGILLNLNLNLNLNEYVAGSKNGKNAMEE